MTDTALAPPWSQRRCWYWPTAPVAAPRMRLDLRTFLDASRLPDDELDDLVLAACEAAANCIEHARPSPPWFTVTADVGPQLVLVRVQDHGHWRGARTGDGRGRGLRMMDALADTTLTVSRRCTTVQLRNRAQGTA